MFRIVAAFALLLVASAYRVRRDTATDIKTKVETSVKNLADNFEETCTSVFDENAKFIGWNGKVMNGRDEICEKLRGRVEMFKMATKVDYTVDNLIEEGDLAIAFATMTMTVKHGETEHQKNMKALAIFKKVDGDLKLLVEGVYKQGGRGGHRHHHRERRDAGSATEKLAALMEKVKALQAEGKLEEIVNLVYTDDIKMFTPKGKLIEGKAAILEFYKKKIAEHGKPKVEATIKHVIEDGDIAIAIGEKKMTKEGETEPKTFTFITVFKADGDSYKAIAKANFYVHEHDHMHSESSSEES